MQSYRDKALRVPCPKCGSSPGQVCAGIRVDERKAVHRARYTRWKKENKR